MIQRISLSFLLITSIVACDDQNAIEEAAAEQQASADSLKTDNEIKVPTFQATVDTVAMAQFTEYRENVAELSIWQKYDQSIGEYMVWSDKLWGRCCTEADMRFTEFCSYDVTTSHDYEAYPFQNALDDNLSTCYVFELKDSIAIKVKFNNDAAVYYDGTRTVSDYIDEDMFVHRKFQMSWVNGYTKSQKTWEENARVKEVELWLNGEHKCNVTLLDQPEVQIIQGNFKFYKNDVVEIKPVSVYPGTQYDDICISAIQTSLGYGANPELDKLIDY